jgi:hypothetical protein
MDNTNKLECPRLARANIDSVKLVERDAGFEHETRDCFVKALQAVTGVPYRDAHNFCETFMGRKPKHGTYPTSYMTQAVTEEFTVFGYRIFKHDASLGTRVRRNWYGTTVVRSYPTLTQFVKSHPRGRYIIWSDDHALAVIDGVVYDNGAAGPRIRITGVYGLVPSSQV